MTTDEHFQTMTEFIRDSEEKFTVGGTTLVAAELSWGALAHGLIAVAELNGWRCEGHQGYREVGKQLEAGGQRKRWTSDVAAGEQLHRHFYQGHLTNRELQRCRVAVAQGTRELALMLDQSGNG